MPKLRVLLVDDHPGFLERTRRLLEDVLSVDVVGVAYSGEDAVASVPSLSPDFVLMDIAMPGIGGLEATRRIRQLNPSVRVVVVTAYDDEEYRVAAAEAGADGFIAKADLAGGIQDILRTLGEKSESA